MTVTAVAAKVMMILLIDGGRNDDKVTVTTTVAKVPLTSMDYGILQFPASPP